MKLAAAQAPSCHTCRPDSVKSGQRINYCFAFVAGGRDGVHLKIWDIRPEAMTPVGGLLIPEVAVLLPHAVREFEFPVKRLVYMAKGQNITLKTLIGQGLSLDVSLEISRRVLQRDFMGGIPEPPGGRLWSGLVTCRIGPR
ncbi:MAG TPA: hypothetical protein VKX25_07095 [Bryobacteraceae bacterium]|jgi:hypothetical protein|nr:hypothetical protein [Bryobacteraceae bacterium]